MMFLMLSTLRSWECCRFKKQESGLVSPSKMMACEISPGLLTMSDSFILSASKYTPPSSGWLK